jgi:chaperone modulatory protein CbpM
MSREDPETVVLSVLDERTVLDVAEFARACGTSTAIVEELVIEGLVVRGPATDGFTGDMVARVRRVLSLQRAFDAPLACAMVMLELLDEIERLRARLPPSASAPPSTAPRTDV